MKPRLITITLLLVLAVGAFVLNHETAQIPDSQAALEDKLDRPLLAFAIWDNTPYFVFRMTPESDELTFDAAHRTCCQMGIPFWNEWQWNAEWRTQPVTDAGASVAWAAGSWGVALWGQITDSRVRYLNPVGGLRYEIQGQAYLVRLPETAEKPATVQFLDEEGTVLFTVEVV